MPSIFVRLETVSPAQAKNKSWFGIMESYRMLDSCWTVLSETTRFAQTQLGNMDEDDDNDEGGSDDDDAYLLLSDHTFNSFLFCVL